MPFNNKTGGFLPFAAALLCTLAPLTQAQTPQPLPTLTLAQAEAIAFKNHPQIQAAQNEVNFANQQIIENRAAYYPTVAGEVTASQGSSDLARIGAGDLSASRLFNRQAKASS